MFSIILHRIYPFLQKGIIPIMQDVNMHKLLISGCGADEIEFDTGICISTSVTDGAFITSIINIAAFLGTFLTLVMIVIGAYKMMMSGGDSAKIKDGKDQITNAMLGLMMILLSTVIVNLVIGMLGIT